MKIAAVIPMKQQSLCKRRLAPALTRPQRQFLAFWMLDRVVTQLRASGSIDRIFVVTTQECPIPRGTTRIVDPGKGLNAALELAGTRIHRMGLDGILILPGDVPLVQAADIRSLLRAVRPRSWVLVPDTKGRGTNALLANPANLTEAHFGVDSFARHIEAAIASGINVVIHRCDNLARDIDEPCDLSLLRMCPDGCPIDTWNLPGSGLRDERVSA